MKTICLFVVAFVGLATAQNSAHFSYSYLAGENFQSVNMTVNLGFTVFDAIRMKAWGEEEIWGIKSGDFDDYGRVITSIGGLANDYNKRLAWYYYVLPEYPSQQIPDDQYISKVSVDNTPVADNGHYLFVYRQMMEN